MKRVIGTTLDAIHQEESKLGRTLPPSFVAWLLKNNGLSIEGVHIYPVRDERDVRKTWESLSYNISRGWAAWLENFQEQNMDFGGLLPFADYGTGDYYCFDYSQVAESGECPVVRWSHETGENEFRAQSFSEFEAMVRAGQFIND